MKFVLALVFLAMCVQTQASVVPSLAAFDWTKWGSFLANGTLYTRALYPNSTVVRSNPAWLALDTVNGRISINVDANHTEYINQNGAFLWFDGVCYNVTSYTYSRFLYAYTAAVEVWKYWNENGDRRNVYSGNVLYVACNHTASISLVQTPAGKILSYNFGEILNFISPGCFVGQVVGDFIYTHWQRGVPDESYFQLPSACATPVDYCTAFYPPTCHIVSPFAL
jgi:hypothetical protein